MVGEDIIAEKKRLEKELVGVKGVIGVGADIGRGVIIVYVETDEDAERLKREVVSRFSVEFKVVGRVTAYG